MTDDDGKSREESTSNWVDRSNGRRREDRHKCAMHDYLQNKNDHCFEIIKDTIREEVRARDRKFEVLEAKLENFISKWAVGMIILICTSLFGAFFGLGMWQFDNMHKQLTVMSQTMNRISHEVAIISNNQIGISNNQIGILKELESIAPEHRVLMQHLSESNMKDEK